MKLLLFVCHFRSWRYSVIIRNYGGGNNWTQQCVPLLSHIVSAYSFLLLIFHLLPAQPEKEDNACVSCLHLLFSSLRTRRHRRCRNEKMVKVFKCYDFPESKLWESSLFVGRRKRSVPGSRPGNPDTRFYFHCKYKWNVRKRMYL